MRVRDRLVLGLALVGLSAGRVVLPRALAQSPPAQPQVQIVDPPAGAAANQLLSFGAVVSADVDAGSVAWGFGDGATGAGLTASHAYRTAGSYTLVATLTDDAGDLSQAAAEITVSDSATLASGEQMTFASPFVPEQAASQDAGVGEAGPLDVEVENRSSQPLVVAYAGGSDEGSAANKQAQVELAAAAGEALQVLIPSLSDAVSPTGPDVLQGCVPIGGAANEAACAVATAATPAGLMQLAVHVANAGSVEGLTLPPGAAVALLGPIAAAPAPGGVPAILVRSGSDQTTAITWDGATLAIAAPGDYAVSVDEIRGLLPGAAAQAVDCSTPDGQPSAVVCSIAAIPPVAVRFSTLAGGVATSW